MANKAFNKLFLSTAVIFISSFLLLLTSCKHSLHQSEPYISSSCTSFDPFKTTLANDTSVAALTSAGAVTSTPYEAAITEQATDTITIPDSFYRDRGVVFCSSVVIPSQYNDIAEDINAYIDTSSKTVFFLMSCRSDLSRVVYHCLNVSGARTVTQVADFTDDIVSNSEKLKINGVEYTLKALKSNAPTLHITLNGEYPSFNDINSDPKKETKGYGNIKLEVSDEMSEKYGYEKLYQSIDIDSDTPCSAYLKGRGNASWLNFDKKTYMIRFENKVNLLGMGSAKKFVLVSNASDPVALKNQIAYELAKRMNIAYTTDYETVDVFVDHNYIGSYTLAEKVEIGKNRVDIEDLEELTEREDNNYGKIREIKTPNGAKVRYNTGVDDPDDITGGYIIEMDLAYRAYEEKSWVRTSRSESLGNSVFSVISPEYLSENQALYIGTLIQDLEDAIYSKDGISPTTRKHYSEILDVDSMILKYWLDEIMKNTDCQISSVFFYKPSDATSTKIFAGPPWDYDNTFGGKNCDYFARYQKYYSKLFEFDDFRSRADELYKTSVYPATRTMLFKGVLDDIIEKTQSSVEMNNIIWNNLGTSRYIDITQDYISFFSKRTSYYYHNIK